IPIEAALLARNIAPGLRRSFAAEAWPRVPKSLWDEARREAADLATGRLEAPILASDLDTVVPDRARQHARQAGVDGDIEFQQMPLADVSTHRKYGCVICNPPYGERLGDVAAAEAVYRDMARVFAKLDTWSVYVLTSHPQFERIYGRKAD